MFFSEQVLRSLGCPRTCYVAEACLELTHLSQPPKCLDRMCEPPDLKIHFFSKYLAKKFYIIKVLKGMKKKFQMSKAHSLQSCRSQGCKSITHRGVNCDKKQNKDLRCDGQRPVVVNYTSVNLGYTTLVIFK